MHLQNLCVRCCCLIQVNSLLSRSTGHGCQESAVGGLVCSVNTGRQDSHWDQMQYILGQTTSMFARARCARPTSTPFFTSLQTSEQALNGLKGLPPGGNCAPLRTTAGSGVGPTSENAALVNHLSVSMLGLLIPALPQLLVVLLLLSLSATRRRCLRPERPVLSYQRAPTRLPGTAVVP